jgi:hypothetical protein
MCKLQALPDLDDDIINILSEEEDESDYEDQNDHEICNVEIHAQCSVPQSEYTYQFTRDQTDDSDGSNNVEDVQEAQSEEEVTQPEGVQI